MILILNISTRLRTITKKNTKLDILIIDINIRKLEYIDIKVARIPVSKELANLDNTDLLVASDYDCLYPSAMSLPYWKWPETETAKANTVESSDRKYYRI